MLERILDVQPEEIEKKSLGIITGLLAGRKFPEGHDTVVKRVIHTTADLEYADILRIAPAAVPAALEGIRGGCNIFTDTRMAEAGINKRLLARFGGRVRCLIDDEAVAAEASRQGVTRSAVAVDKAAADPGIGIFAIGNAPTALIRLYECITEGRADPRCVIGVPVGFVNVVEAKELFVKAPGVPSILTVGRKGGSAVAAAVVNALLYMAAGMDRE